MKNIKTIVLDLGGTLIAPVTGSWYITPYMWDILKNEKQFFGKKKLLDESVRKAREAIKDVILIDSIQEEYSLYKKFYSTLVTEGQLDFLSKNQIEQIAYNRAYGKGNYYFLDSINELLHLLSSNKLILFSNTWPSVIEFLKEENVIEVFDEIIVSYKIGCKKPKRESYQHLLNKIDCLPQEVLFVDDNEKCREIAREIGMLTLDAEEFRKELLRKYKEKF